MKMVRLEKELSEEVLSSALEGKKKTSFPSKKRHPLWLKTIKLWGENKGNEKSAEYQSKFNLLKITKFCDLWTVKIKMFVLQEY